MLWAAILFIWELVGIDLEKAKEAGGNAGAIIGALKSPQAIPWALVILVLYFAFKLRTEWRQCHPTRRQVLEAKQDYYLAFLIAGAACVLYFGQAISRIQFANAIQGSSRTSSVMAGASAGFGIMVWGYFLWERQIYKRILKKERNDLIGIGFAYLFLFGIVVPVLLARVQVLVGSFVLLGLGLGLALSTVSILFAPARKRLIAEAQASRAGKV